MALVQDPSGAERRTMPDAAIAADRADAVLPLEEIGHVPLRSCCGTTQRPVTEREPST